MAEFRKYGSDKEWDAEVDHKNWKVRWGAAHAGYGLDKLINDEYPGVRKAVAEQGYGLDVLVNDKDDEVRIEVANQGYGLDKLVNDESWMVRIHVATHHGYGLDKLINDENPLVRKAVQEYLQENNLSLEEWKNRTQDKDDMER